MRRKKKKKHTLSIDNIVVERGHSCSLSCYAILNTTRYLSEVVSVPSHFYDIYKRKSVTVKPFRRY